MTRRSPGRRTREDRRDSRHKYVPVSFRGFKLTRTFVHRHRPEELLQHGKQLLTVLGMRPYDRSQVMFCPQPGQRASGEVRIRLCKPRCDLRLWMWRHAGERAQVRDFRSHGPRSRLEQGSCNRCRFDSRWKMNPPARSVCFSLRVVIYPSILSGCRTTHLCEALAYPKRVHSYCEDCDACVEGWTMR